MSGDLSCGGPVRPGAVEDYLRDIEAQIPRWRRARRLVMAELADGLTDAIRHYLDRGESEEQAVTRAIRDTGPAAVVAAAIAGMLAAGQARRTAITLLLTGPLVGLVWLITLVPGRRPSALLLARPGVGLLVLIAAVFAGLTVAATGSAAARLPLPAIDAVRTAAVACAAATACDVALLSAVLVDPGGLGWTAAGAGVVSAVRLVLSQRVARRDLMSAPTVS